MSQQAGRPVGSEQFTPITAAVLKHAGMIAQEANASALFIYAEALAGREWTAPEFLNGRVFYVLRPSERKGDFLPGHQVIEVPDIRLSRMDQIKIAVLNAMSRGLLSRSDVIACLTGAPGSGELDTIAIIEVAKEFDLFFLDNTNLRLPPDVNPGVLDKVVSLATELASEGREGHSRGTILVVGDTDRALSFTKQLIMNPLKGYPDEERNILDPSLDETVKELSALDGAFIIRGDGAIETAGAYLRITSSADLNLPAGLGARHQAAAGITAVTRSIAVTVSQSTGIVSIFRNGILIMEIERPQSTPSVRRPGRA
jgi:DNA integrity scanning protein DisA with diadenylate cyclase activity